MKIGLLTCRNWPGILEKENAMAAELRRPGLDVAALIWNDPHVAWERYDALIFRSVWDYFELSADFYVWLEHLKAIGARTFNPLPVIERNLHKFYLRTLEAQGVDIIPTVFISKNDRLDLSFLQEKGWEKAIIKPAVSAGSYQTKLFAQTEAAAIEAEYAPIAAEKDLLVQPFIAEIQTAGELSLLFFQGQYSHAVVKRPKPGDFRIQNQHGGRYEAYEPDAALIATAERIVATFGGELLYARVDGILKDGVFLLMELELIEPDLYFDYAPAARKRYAQAVWNALGF